jgi:hypothetical protein
MFIDAKNDRAAQWYSSYGAVPLANHPLTLAILLETFVEGLSGKGLFERPGDDQ